MAEKRRESTKRFGARYGRHLKEKVAEIEAGYRGKHKCPYCGKKNAKRLALGIWFCKSCKTKFTGKAYSISKKIVVREEKEEPIEKGKIIKSEKESGISQTKEKV